jgi:tetratricopeptide (TPR) repeat protein
VRAKIDAGLRAARLAIGSTGMPTALEAMRDLRRRSVAAGRPDLAAVCDLALGASLRAAGEIPTALRHLRYATEVLPAGHERVLAVCELVQAECAGGRLAEARAALAAVPEDATPDASRLLASATLLLAEARFDEAIATFSRAERRDASGEDVAPAASLGRAAALRVAGRLRESLEVLDALATGARPGDDGSLILERARTLLSLGETAAAAAHLTTARARFEALGMSFRVAECDVESAAILVDGGATDTARPALARALRVFSRVEFHAGVARCLLVEARLESGIAAELRLRSARASFSSAGSPIGLAETETRLAALASAAGDEFAAESYADSARARLAAHGLWVEVARSDVARAESWLTQARNETDERRRAALRGHAAEAALPAAVFLDFQRFDLHRGDQRAVWITSVAARASRVAFEAALALGDPRLVAELVADRRATGSYVLADRTTRLTPPPLVRVGRDRIALADVHALVASLYGQDARARAVIGL